MNNSQKNIKNTNSSQEDWICSNCGDTNFRFRIRCWRCNTRSKEKSKRLESHDWVCVCGVMNFGRRLICMKCGRSKTDQEKNLDISTPRAGDWICTCGEHNFTRRHQCRKCHKEREKELLSKKKGDWLCESCHTHNYRSRDICHQCFHPKYGVHEIKGELKCIVCRDLETTMAIKKCGHFCLCETCGFVLTNCPICQEVYDGPRDLIKIVDF